MSKAKQTKVKKEKKNVVVGTAYIQSTFNNTIITITDLKGNVLTASSAGAHKFSGAKKSTPYAAQVVADHVSQIAMSHGMKKISVVVKGPGSGRESAIRSLHNTGLEVISIKDVTPVAHNGCKARKKRRV